MRSKSHLIFSGLSLLLEILHCYFVQKSRQKFKIVKAEKKLNDLHMKNSLSKFFPQISSEKKMVDINFHIERQFCYKTYKITPSVTATSWKHTKLLQCCKQRGNMHYTCTVLGNMHYTCTVYSVGKHALYLYSVGKHALFFESPPKCFLCLTHCYKNSVWDTPQKRLFSSTES